MRTNIEIDDRLMRDAMRASGGRTKRAVVEAALRLLVQTKAQAAIRRLRGKVEWDGDLDVSRSDRVSPSPLAVVIVDATVCVDYLQSTSTPEADWLDRELTRQHFGLTDSIPLRSAVRNLLRPTGCTRST